jgi:hypothetical protein
MGDGDGMTPSAAQLRELKRTNLSYPKHLVDLPRECWPDMNRSPFLTGSVPVKVMRSRSFMLVVWREANDYFRLSVNRTEWDERQKRFRDDISWDDLQRLKAEAGFGDLCAVEVYPPDEHVVNVANMRHLFLTTELPFMWRRSNQSSVAA